MFINVFGMVRSELSRRVISEANSIQCLKNILHEQDGLGLIQLAAFQSFLHRFAQVGLARQHR